jgi:hypothetical protein
MPMLRPRAPDPPEGPHRFATYQALEDARHLGLRIDEQDCRTAALTIMDAVAGDGRVAGDAAGATFVGRDVRTGRERWRLRLRGRLVDVIYLPFGPRVLDIREALVPELRS